MPEEVEKLVSEISISDDDDLEGTIVVEVE